MAVKSLSVICQAQLTDDASRLSTLKLDDEPRSSTSPAAPGRRRVVFRDRRHLPLQR